MFERFGGRGVFVLVLLAFVLPCSAQWMTQQVDLKPGWNAIYLNVQPAAESIDALFEGQPVESVWMWNKRFSTIDFDVDPNTLLPDDPHWLVWFPASNPESFLRRLFGMSASSAYLVKVDPTAAPFSVLIKGQPRLPSYEWVPHALNLVGFPANPSHPPLFSDFFQHTDCIDTTRGFENELYSLGVDGKGQCIVAPARTPIIPGAAYWIGCGMAPKHTTPMPVDVRGLEMNFGTVLSEQDMTVINPSNTDSLTVSIRQIASENPPEDGAFLERAGDVPLSHLVYNAMEHHWDWVDLVMGEPLSKTLAPGEEWLVRFGVRRGDFATYHPTGTNGASYQSVLEISGFDGSVLCHVGVEAQNETLKALALKEDSENPPTEAQHADKGLWVGDVVLNQVNCPAYSSTNLLSTDSLCSFRMIVHVDDSGQAKLLQEIFMAWAPLSTTNGTYQLYADRTDLPANATQISRISSVNFPFMEPVVLSGSFSNALTGTITLDCNDPLNPFLHRYNPMHDNKDWDYNTHSNAVETLTVSREITMEFSDGTSSNAVAHPLWGVDMNGGVYRETLTGLRAQPILVEGIFSLRRISTLHTLN